MQPHPSTKEIDCRFIRESSGGMHTGMGGLSRPGTKDETTVQNMACTYAQVERCLRYGFKYARTHGKKVRGAGAENTLALVDKSNVLTCMYELWNRIFAEIGKEYPDVKSMEAGKMGISTTKVGDRVASYLS